MTRDDIIRMAREVADKDTVDPVHGDPPFIVLTPDEMIRFAALVAAAEREKICAALRTFHDSLSCASHSTGLRKDDPQT